VHDHLGPGLGDRRMDGLGVEPVGDGGLGAQRADERRFARRVRQPDDAVARGDEQRHEAPSDGAARAGNENAHVVRPLSVAAADNWGRW